VHVLWLCRISEMYVSDESDGRIPVHIDVLLPRMQCQCKLTMFLPAFFIYYISSLFSLVFWAKCGIDTGSLHFLLCTRWIYCLALYCIHWMAFVADLGLDLQDSLGRHELGAVENVIRLPVNNSEGCHFTAHFKIKRVHAFVVYFVIDLNFGTFQYSCGKWFLWYSACFCYEFSDCLILVAHQANIIYSKTSGRSQVS